MPGLDGRWLFSNLHLINCEEELPPPPQIPAAFLPAPLFLSFKQESFYTCVCIYTYMCMYVKNSGYFVNSLAREL